MISTCFYTLLLINGINGFIIQSSTLPQITREHNSSSKTSLNANAKSIVERREVVTGALLLISSTVALAGGKQSVPSTLEPLSKEEKEIVPVSSIQQLSSVDEALNLIESSCDRRYLHAIVASDYKLMYRGIPSTNKNYPSLHVNEASDLLLPSTYDSKDALQFFTMLQEKMSEKVIKPSNGHLATTSIEDAKLWGGDYASVWPLDDGDVHYAWLEDGGEFWPTSNEITSNVNDYTNSRKVIVDGIDCGRMSLDDALEKKGGKDYEIMFRANKFLLVPSRYEQELLSGLKSAFII